MCRVVGRLRVFGGSVGGVDVGIEEMVRYGVGIG